MYPNKLVKYKSKYNLLQLKRDFHGIEHYLSQGNKTIAQRYGESAIKHLLRATKISSVLRGGAPEDVDDTGVKKWFYFFISGTDEQNNFTKKLEKYEVTYPDSTPVNATIPTNILTNDTIREKVLYTSLNPKKLFPVFFYELDLPEDTTTENVLSKIDSIHKLRQHIKLDSPYLEEFKEYFINHVDRIKKNIQSLKNAHSTQSDAVNKSADKIQDLEAQVVALTATAGTSQTEIDALRTQVTNLQKDKAELETELTKVSDLEKQHVEFLANQIADIDNAFKGLDGALA